VKRIDDMEIISDILRVSEIMNRVPSASEYRRLGKFSIPSLYSRKPWGAWLTDIFPDHEPRRFPGQECRSASKEELLSELSRIAAKLGKPPSTAEVERESSIPACRYTQEFGTLESALRRLGMSRSLLSKEDIVSSIKGVASDIGRVPMQAEFLSRSRSVGSSASISRLFGSWNSALAEADLEPIKFRKADPSDVARSVRAWLEDNGGDTACLRYWSIVKARKRGKFRYAANTIKSCFPGKSWEEAISACGVEYKTQNQFFCRGSFRGADGAAYLSSMEKDAADELLAMRELGEIDSYEYEVRVCDDRKWTCDFVVRRGGGELWMEVDGMGKSRYVPYDMGNEKIGHYEKSGMNYAVVSGPDMSRAVRRAVGELLLKGGKHGKKNDRPKISACVSCGPVGQAGEKQHREKGR